jgi:anti-sigma regulatory factor (Ser/Thr protein kinase)
LEDRRDGYRGYVRAADAAFEPTIDAPRSSRAFIREHLAEWGALECEHEAVLVVTELVTNVVRHAATRIHIHAEFEAPNLRVEVRDGSSVVPAVVDLVDEEYGRGLRIVQELATDWGIEQRDDGKAVWFTVTVEPRALA